MNQPYTDEFFYRIAKESEISTSDIDGSAGEVCVSLKMGLVNSLKNKDQYEAISDSMKTVLATQLFPDNFKEQIKHITAITQEEYEAWLLINEEEDEDEYYEECKDEYYEYKDEEEVDKDGGV